MRDERIGGGFEEGEAAGDDEEGEEEETVTAGDGGGPEEEGTRGVEQKSDDETGFVAGALHHECGGDGEEEVAHIESGLHEAGLKAGDGERLHEMADEDVVEIVGNAPEEEEGGDEDEGEEMSGGK